ncbi:MAG: erythromycin biosynthesis sensory transduction protein eryC1 [bacterium]|nr:erythromycin biosynthesis sensory transduction protein eryC1 [bacterium]
MKVPFVDLHALHEPIAAEIQAEVSAVIERGDFILGENVARFEEEFAAYCGVSHAAGLDSGLSALELGLRAMGIGEGDEVILPANTFIASAAAVSATGARPVLVDIDPVTYNIDPASADQAVTPRTKAIMPVHLYGQPAEMDSIMQLARKRGLKMIEDASQAHGAEYRGRRVGSFGDCAAFSLYPAKNLGAFGDAGVLVSNNADLIDKVKTYRNYGSLKKYHHVEQPFNRRLDTLQAAVLRVKLRKLDEWNQGRRRAAAAYRERLAGLVETPDEATNAMHVYHLFVVRCNERDALQAHLSERGVGSVLHYPIPIHLQPCYASLGHREGDFPITEQYAKTILSLPMFPTLGDEQIGAVVDAIRQWKTERA